MRFKIDHDLHIHTKLSFCSMKPEQTPENILKYGEKHGYKTLCLTDHMWDTARIPTDDDFYKNQTYEYICGSLPLPQSDKVKMLFGCETDLNKDMVLGVSSEVMDKLDFIIIPLNHFHMGGFTCRGGESSEELAKLVIDRFDGVLDMDLPFHKIGIAHFSDACIGARYWNALKMIPDSEYRRIFAKAADRGIGIELNMELSDLKGDYKDTILMPYFFAKDAGCKFYLGSDIHSQRKVPDLPEIFDIVVDTLDLKESDKFIIGK